MSINRQVRGENRFYMAPPMRKLQQEREKKRLEAEEEKRKAKDLLITNSSNSVRQYSDSIPADILIDIFLRVPEKSIGRFRCVSKFWKSILGRPDFTELFLTKSVASTRLFLAVKDKEELLVFSSPQPLNPNNNSSLVATATHYKSFPKHFPNGVLEICNSLCGFVFLQSLSGKQRVICNPVTGECITLRSLPNVTSNRIMGNYLGFDPINKQFKVLCMTWSRNNGTPNTHWVLTLGTGKRIWRTIHDPFVFHYARCRICINGVLYYIADFDGSYYEIVCFDFRFEKFSLINMDGDMLINNRYGLILLPGLTLFNNKGKLGAYTYQPWGNEELLELWVLEDARKHKWSKRVCVLPTFRNNILKNQGYYIIGMTVTGEIVFTPYQLSNPFYIFYYNIERNTFTRVNIQGFEEFYWGRPVIHTFLHYVESVQGFIT